MSHRTQNKPSSFTRKAIIIFLIFTNLCTVFLLLNIQYNIAKVKKQRLQELSAADTLKYDQNPNFIEQTQLFDMYEPGQVNIVMLGSSFTQRVHWNELLVRKDVANRGIGSDISEGYLHRVNTVLNLKPRVCFIEIGANDIVKDIAADSIYRNTLQLIDLLKPHIHNIFVTKCFYVSSTFPAYAKFNAKADSLNKLISTLPATMLIDINPQMSDNNIRRPEFALADGIHLNAKGYLVWKKAIEKALLHVHLAAE